jgi:hypothetical protein
VGIIVSHRNARVTLVSTILKALVSTVVFLQKKVPMFLPNQLVGVSTPGGPWTDE